MKIAQIVGARPQFVKLAPLSRLIRQKHEEIIIHSGQHYDSRMDEVFFRDMRIPHPDVNLNAGSKSQAPQTAIILEGVESALLEHKPDLVIVYGDTNTTLAGALASAKLGLRTAHVEAGLRSFNRFMPEEINRVVADHVSNILLCPTATAMENARREGLEDKCHLVGDIMTDSLRMALELASGTNGILKDLGLQNQAFSLLTLHRPYNVDDPASLHKILSGLDGLGLKIVFPVHPRTRRIIEQTGRTKFRNIRLILPQSYLDFISLMQAAEMVLTDSGGIQKEAYILGKPCVTLRSETEWTETVASGWNLLLPVDSPSFPEAIAEFQVPRERPDIFGSNVASKI
ncbi:MAG: UDP-N-acetylglucosamine 2-epimerase (non-hydrolyzing), partial [Candidatus Syntrophosphaera sp.]